MGGLIVDIESLFLAPGTQSLYNVDSPVLGSLTAEQMKNPYRSHKAYIFLSSFLIFYVAICGYMWYNKA